MSERLGAHRGREVRRRKREERESASERARWGGARESARERERVRAGETCRVAPTPFAKRHGAPSPRGAASRAAPKTWSARPSAKSSAEHLRHSAGALAEDASIRAANGPMVWGSLAEWEDALLPSLPRAVRPAMHFAHARYRRECRRASALRPLLPHTHTHTHAHTHVHVCI